MQLTTALSLCALAGLSAAQTLKIPTRVGSIVSLSKPSTISGSFDGGNREFDRGRPCNSDDDTGSDDSPEPERPGRARADRVGSQ